MYTKHSKFNDIAVLKQKLLHLQDDLSTLKKLFFFFLCFYSSSIAWRNCFFTQFLHLPVHSCDSWVGSAAAGVGTTSVEAATGYIMLCLTVNFTICNIFPNWFLLPSSILMTKTNLFIFNFNLSTFVYNIILF